MCTQMASFFGRINRSLLSSYWLNPSIPTLRNQEQLSAIKIARFSSLIDQFQNAQQRLTQDLKQNPGNDIKLKLYALYKQATEGRVNSKRPGMTNFVGRAKWDAWNSLGEMPQDDAKLKYIELVNELLGSSKENSCESSNTPQTDNEICQEPGFKVTKNGRLRIIKINKPERRNAFTTSMYQGFVNLLKDAAEDPETSIVAITGEGNFFCSGNDLTNLTNFSGTVEEAATRGGKILQEFVDSLIDFPKPIVAVVNGPAIGIACTILGLMDAVYATDRGWFYTPFTALGQSPEACSSLIFPRIMGTAKAMEMLIFNKKITTFEACKLGLVTEVYPDALLHSEVWPRLEELSKLPIKSMIYGKELCRQFDRELLHRVNKAECDRLLERWQSEDCMEAVMEFFKKKDI